ncbi:bifunctional pyr operon transcriptional regulator/uracil phosphoribosyltransferase PyrR [Lactobacillus paragasseri]|uniref:bifunctional pyr operon transcriptional regulator/uracil phosphoribosyltransferase PyrR n=1 Tax=Lactobacillus paragasseri TaxID=2107999 RepID=UPI00057C72EB|nr:bifunctional pyr operon transcriptional regulator/uracil phosphoribosyltransferase PyrR [Lactobacillus paragasseri]MDK7067208.1 bifunctional pyr operon transcriptional regulator/uracil phosphoribosyltransferase PyrR [Lactobacillus paragasseri]
MAKEIWDALAMKRAITRITYEIIEKNKGTDDLALVGIKTRGVYLAKRIHDRIQKLENVDVPVDELDITLYRDDRHDASLKQDPVVNSNKINIDINNKNVILIDDVIYTGRTIRAAMDALMDDGRPSSIRVAVLVDRGHRELPIRADFVGKNIPTSTDEQVAVNMVEKDGKDSVELKTLPK